MRKKENHLVNASSPYLQQHANNPVDWYEWGEEALCRARDENKPILISIGYAACHWCHVMAHESFEDEEVAGYMNAHFINIKIDREERPDIDQIYMEAAQVISGRGGWPLNAFALPDGKPFYAATYYPKNDWMNLLQQIHNIYLKDYGKLEEQANSITNGIKKNNYKLIDTESTGNYDKEYYNSLFAAWDEIIDYKLGGFKRAPKFPLPISWEFLLQYYYLTDNPKALKAVEITLDEIARGGIYDQVGGGFARYSVDEYWKAPHFEKMLYDNGQLISLYSHAFMITKNPIYSDVIKHTLAFVERELMSPSNGFYSSLDADSEGVEGKFYVWTNDDIERVLSGRQLTLIKEFYQIQREGNWEDGNNILHAKVSKSQFEKEHNLAESEFSSILNNANEKLLLARGERIRPGTDDKILTSWNALMMKGYIDAYKAIGKQEYLRTAINNALFLEKYMIKEDGSLWRSFKNMKTSVDAFLDDYALLADAYIQLYQVTLNKHWLDLSKQLADYVMSHFSDFNTKLFFYTSDQSESLIARKHEVPDNVIPSSNSVFANVLHRLGLYYDTKKYTNRSLNMLKQVRDDIYTGGPYYANWGILYGMISHQSFEVAVLGNDAQDKLQQLQKHYLPTSIFLGGKRENLSLLENKLINNKTLVYVCRNKVCNLPTSNVEEAINQLK